MVLQPPMEAKSFVLRTVVDAPSTSHAAETQPEPPLQENEVNDELLGPNRPVYCGSYRNPKVVEREKECMEGDLKDLEVGTWICVQASSDSEDGRPFWLAKVLSIDAHLPDGSPGRISIVWYTCSEDDDDPFEAKYHVELRSLPESSRSYGRNKPRREENRDTIDVSKTTVLAYNFILKSSMQMLKRTVDKIKIKLKDVDEVGQDISGCAT